MIDENNGCITKSKLTKKLRHLYIITEARQQPNKQTKILSDTETDKHLDRKHAKRRKILTYKKTHKQNYCGHKHAEN